MRRLCNIKLLVTSGHPRAPGVEILYYLFLEVAYVCRGTRVPRGLKYKNTVAIISSIGRGTRVPRGLKSLLLQLCGAGLKSGHPRAPGVEIDLSAYLAKIWVVGAPACPGG